MRVIKNGRELKKMKGPVITLGNFDGLHLGHQRILKKVSERAKALGCPSVVYTFEPHPLKVVAPRKSPPLITDMEDKAIIIESFGIDFLLLARFTKEFASRHPGEFVEDELVRGLSAKEVFVGHDYAFGRGKLGTVEHLKGLGGDFGFSVTVIPAYKKKGRVVSSSRVRELVTTGEVREAAGLLGRDYSIKGRVVRGRDMGREIGYPTANLKVTSELIPKRGVYASYVTVNKARHPGVVNIGTAPTVGGKKISVEAHILDFERKIYGKKIEVSFVRRLRDEKKFGSKEELSRQIRKDTQRARRMLGA
jgi:riboflavin kinase/FMN adenylyltransferase